MQSFNYIFAISFTYLLGTSIEKNAISSTFSSAAEVHMP